MLAQSARKAGYVPLVIDLFGDGDTREAAKDVIVIDSLEPAALSSACDRIIGRNRICGVVYGSGLECYPQTLTLLAASFKLLGNTPDTFEKIQNKTQFFAILEQLNITFPEARFIAPDDAGKWLIKPFAGQGGQHIRHYREPTSPIRSTRPPGCKLAAHDQGFYWQRYVSGQPMSVLFLADGQNQRIIGFNREWSLPGSFVFSGIVHDAEFPEGQRRLIENWLQKLVPVFKLKGLNSLDFIWDGKRCRVLEINPRPSASMAIYENDYTDGLLNEHLKCCRGQLSRYTPQTNKTIQAYRIVYAERDMRITGNIDWPLWCMDRPYAACIIRAGRPICSIMAAGNCLREVYRLLQTRQQLVINKFRE